MKSGRSSKVGRIQYFLVSDLRTLYVLSNLLVEWEKKMVFVLTGKIICFSSWCLYLFLLWMCPDLLSLCLSLFPQYLFTLELFQCKLVWFCNAGGGLKGPLDWNFWSTTFLSSNIFCCPLFVRVVIFCNSEKILHIWIRLGLFSEWFHFVSSCFVEKKKWMFSLWRQKCFTSKTLLGFSVPGKK